MNEEIKVLNFKIETINSITYITYLFLINVSIEADINGAFVGFCFALLFYSRILVAADSYRILLIILSFARTNGYKLWTVGIFLNILQKTVNLLDSIFPKWMIKVSWRDVFSVINCGIFKLLYFYDEGIKNPTSESI